MGKSYGQCHFCKKWNRVSYAFCFTCHIFNIIFEKNIVLVEENLIIGVYEGEITEDLLLVNLVICILKWVIWKIRNYIKYNKHIYREAIVILKKFKKWTQRCFYSYCWICWPSFFKCSLLIHNDSNIMSVLGLKKYYIFVRTQNVHMWI